MMNRVFAKNSFTLILSASVIFTGFAFVQVHAGFEWIPPEEESAPVQPASRSMPDTPPLPSMNDLLPPISTLNEGDKVIQEPKIINAPEIVINEPVIKTHSFVEPQAPAAQAAPIIQRIQPAPVPVAPMPPEAELIATTRIVVPQDAPVSAVNTIDAAQLTINPFPQPVTIEAATPPPANNLQAMPRTQEPRYDISQGYEIVQGFGSELPLALALSQVVPAEFSYAFGAGVNPGLRVSWSGNKSWPIVVEDMVRPLGLVSHVQDQVLHIHHPGQKHISRIAPQAGSSSAQTGQRVAISDPGDIPSEQPAQTLEKILDVVRSSAPEKIEAKPASERTSSSIWSAQQGDSLKRTLDIWSQRADFDLVWDAQYDYQLSSDILVSGDFQRALVSVFSNAMDPANLPNMTVVNSSEDGQKGRLIIQDQNPV